MEEQIIHKPHAVCVPLPFQSHINAMMQVGKLLHSKGFFITFVNTEFNHRRLLKSRGPDFIKGSHKFRFEAIPDGLDSSDDETAQDAWALCFSTQKNCLAPFRKLVEKLNDSPDVPRLTCTISDGFMSFTLQVAEEFGIPGILFWPIAARRFMGWLQVSELIKRGIIPLRDDGLSSDRNLDVIDWIPGTRGICLKDLPGAAAVKDPEDPMIKFMTEETQNSFKASANVIHTFDDLEHEDVSALRSLLARVHTIGPLSLHCHKIAQNSLRSLKMNLWREETGCLEWLDKQEAASVVYVNFGSLSVLTIEQFNELAWGLANSNHPFLWIVRPNAIINGPPILPEKFLKEIEGRGLITSWCPQEEVLSHSSIGCFLTHCGWNSVMESICGGVPMICRPMFGDQPTNSHYACNEWGIGVEISNDMTREEIEGVIREVMEGENGKEMRMKAMKWKDSAENATSPGGLSCTNLDGLINDVFLLGHK